MTKGEKLEYAITKECCTFSLMEWCDEWGVTIDEFKEFLRLGKETFDARRRAMTRNEAIAYLKGLELDMDDYLVGTEIDALNMAIEALSADRPTGEWIAYKGMQPPEFHGKHYCSNCYHTIHLASNGNVYNYCPNCGSRNRKE